MVELLKQEQYYPVPIEEQVVVIWAGASGMLKEVPVSKVSLFEKDFLKFVRKNGIMILTKIREEKKITDDITDKLTKLTKQFLDTWPELKESKIE